MYPLALLVRLVVAELAVVTVAEKHSRSRRIVSGSNLNQSKCRFHLFQCHYCNWYSSCIRWCNLFHHTQPCTKNHSTGKRVDQVLSQEVMVKVMRPALDRCISVSQIHYHHHFEHTCKLMINNYDWYILGLCKRSCNRRIQGKNHLPTYLLAPWRTYIHLTNRT